MPLRLRRGTDAERSAITFQEGELVYTTDTKKVYVGDGSTSGGIPIDTAIGTLILNDVSDVDTITNPPADGDILSYNLAESKWVPSAAPTGGGAASLDDLTDVDLTTTPQVDGNFLQWSNDLNNWVPGIAIDRLQQDLNPRLGANLDLRGYTVLGQGAVSIDGVIAATSFVGDLTGSVFADDSSVIVDGVNGTLNGTLRGDVIGSVFADDSSVLVDSVNGILNGPLTTNTIISDFDLTVDLTAGVNFTKAGFPVISITNDQPGQDLYDGADIHGLVQFRTNDTSGAKTSALIGVSATGLVLSKADATAALPDSHKLAIATDGSFGFGTLTPAEKFDFAGNIKTSGFVQFGSFTKAERDALTPANGMVLYNTTSNKFQGYQNGAWINLDDGLADP